MTGFRIPCVWIPDSFDEPKILDFIWENMLDFGIWTLYKSNYSKIAVNANYARVEENRKISGLGDKKKVGKERR